MNRERTVSFPQSLNINNCPILEINTLKDEYWILLHNKDYAKIEAGKEK